jgi:hypothetical protein
VVVGGVAAGLHGSTRGTLDLDVCAPLDEANLRRILDALRDLHPRFRMHPAKPPLYDDVSRLIGFRNLNLDTDWGVIDILGEITGIGGYAEVAKHAVEMDVSGLVVRVLDLPALIESKRAVGRRKDLEDVLVLEYIRKQKAPGGTDQK